MFVFCTGKAIISSDGSDFSLQLLGISPSLAVASVGAFGAALIGDTTQANRYNFFASVSCDLLVSSYTSDSNSTETAVTAGSRVIARGSLNIAAANEWASPVSLLRSLSPALSALTLVITVPWTSDLAQAAALTLVEVRGALVAPMYLDGGKAAAVSALQFRVVLPGSMNRYFPTYIVAKLQVNIDCCSFFRRIHVSMHVA